MIDLGFLAGKTIAVLGLGASGLAVACALKAGGAHVIAWDDALAMREAAMTEDIRVVEADRWPWPQIDRLVMSPGIPHTHPAPHPVAAAAARTKTPITGDVELLYLSDPQARFVGITGTNGKSTTTHLLGHLFDTAGIPYQVGGNIGVPVAALTPMGKGGTYILEMSSYQLELIGALVFDLSILLNISTDHLERHGGMGGYVTAKRRIFRTSAEWQTAIVGTDDQYSQAILADLARGGAHAAIGISGNRPVVGGVYAEHGILMDAVQGAGAVADLTQIGSLQGAHNHQNAAAAFAAAISLGIEKDSVAAGLKSFPGLAHRQERIGAIGDVVYVNDSKATNAEAAHTALTSFTDIYWIAGGREKEGGIRSLDNQALAGVRHAYLIGEARTDFAATLRGRLPFTLCETLVEATRLASAAAREAGKGVVLLSPACASFDQYANFEARGNAFRMAVLSLIADAEGAA
ncbi:MAG: UDP-N-acetylmuramoyl-L-alanine--D-glutamate ligase [Magnetospiraceae bacterium]